MMITHNAYERSKGGRSHHRNSVRRTTDNLAASTSWMRVRGERCHGHVFDKCSAEGVYKDADETMKAQP